jgi:hypothetical protein
MAILEKLLFGAGTRIYEPQRSGDMIALVLHTVSSTVLIQLVFMLKVIKKKIYKLEFYLVKEGDHGEQANNNVSIFSTSLSNYQKSFFSFHLEFCRYICETIFQSMVLLFL